jgi:hypothetical protein
LRKTEADSITMEVKQWKDLRWLETPIVVKRLYLTH